MSEVKGLQVEEIDHEQDLTPAEFAMDKEGHESHLDNVVENVVRAHICSCVNELGLASEQEVDIAHLQE